MTFDDHSLYFYSIFQSYKALCSQKRDTWIIKYKKQIIEQKFTQFIKMDDNNNNLKGTSGDLKEVRTIYTVRIMATIEDTK